jgi:hypothetical protein
VIVTAPVRVPVAVGENVTLIVQFAPVSTEPPQLLVWTKSPLAARLVIVKVALPVFVSVTDCAALVVPWFWELNARLDVDKLSPGAGVGEGLEMLLPPPPHATQTESSSMAVPRMAHLARRRACVRRAKSIASTSIQTSQRREKPPGQPPNHLRPSGRGAICTWAVVVTVTVVVADVPPPNGSVVGLVAHVAPGGAPVQFNANVPLTPLGVKEST